MGKRCENLGQHTDTIEKGVGGGGVQGPCHSSLTGPHPAGGDVSVF